MLQPRSFDKTSIKYNRDKRRKMNEREKISWKIREKN